MHMSRIINTILLNLFWLSFVNSQQLPHSSLFTETRDLWNPANTAQGDKFYVDVFMRQQWLGFGSGAPTTGFAGLQVPFVEMNMAAGGNLIFDKTGPVSKLGLNLNYAYKLNEVLGDDSQLSLGVSGGFSNYSLNTTGLIVNNGSDDLINGGKVSKFFPSLGAGLYFVSNTDERRASHAFDVGFSMLQAYETNLLVGNQNQKRFSHYVFNMGTKFYGDDGVFYPTFLINFVSPEIMDLQFGAKYEVNNKFWAGLGYSNVSDISVQGGVIMSEFGSRYARLRLGALGNISISDNVSHLGPGFEVLVRYEFDMD